MKSNFIVLHTLKSYGVSNLNRDEEGNVKTCVYGGVTRARISSQCLKRTWRTSEAFVKSIGCDNGYRTQEMGNEIYEKLRTHDCPETKAHEFSCKVAAVFGALDSNEKKKADQRTTKQLVHFSNEEKNAIEQLTTKFIQKGFDIHSFTEDDFDQLIGSGRGTPDIALFGRMIAKKPACNVEAACKVSHAMTTHKVTAEQDFFTAVDDLNMNDHSRGAGHLNTTEYTAGVFYNVCIIHKSQLLANLSQPSGGGKDRATQMELAKKALEGLVQAICTTSPTGKQNSFASCQYAHYVFAEQTSFQPRNLDVAYLGPVSVYEGSETILHQSIKRLQKTYNVMTSKYGMPSEKTLEFNALEEGGATFQDLVAFVSDL